MKKKIALTFIFSICIVFSLYFLINSKNIFTKSNNETNNKVYKMYLENDSGEYELSNSKNFPTDGYTLDTSKSSCSNGSKVSQNQDKTLAVSLSNGDECILYFKKILNTMGKYLTELKTISSTSVQNGIYYFDDDGNLDYGDDKTKIDVNDKIGNVQGLVSIWNKQLIYVCIKDKDTTENGYSWYYGDKGIVSSKYPCQTKRYENLVTNGDLSYKNNFNFEEYGNFDNDAIHIVGVGNDNTSELIPIDPNKKYEFLIDLKSDNNSQRYYGGFSSYDIYKNPIIDRMVSYIDGTDTYLTEDLKNGDTTVHLASLENWTNGDSYYNNSGGVQTYYFRNSMIIWNVSNPVDGDFPLHTYGNYYGNLYDSYSAVDKENNTITLNKEWMGGTIKNGTEISQGNMGSTHNYAAVNGDQVTSEYRTYTSKPVTSYGYNNATLNFRYGTHFIKFFLYSNIGGSTNVNTYIKNVSIKEIK